jgi:hypothetical protein
MTSASVTRRFTYSRAASLTYRVTETLTGRALGTLWRSREGWGYRTLTGQRGEVYGVSRDVAAAALARAAIDGN